MRTGRQVERILHLARRLTGEKYWKRSELVDIYIVHPTTINRHINGLRSIYCQIEGGGKRGWRIREQSIPMAVSPREIQWASWRKERLKNRNPKFRNEKWIHISIHDFDVWHSFRLNPEG